MIDKGPLSLLERQALAEKLRQQASDINKEAERIEQGIANDLAQINKAIAEAIKKCENERNHGRR